MPKLIVNDPVGPVQTPQASAQEFGAGGAVATRQLGRSMQSATLELNAAGEQQARLRATQYRSALQERAQQILDDPRLEGREERLRRAQRDLSRQYRGGMPNVFDREASLVDTQIRSQFVHTTRLQAIEQGQSALSDNLRDMAGEWARADGDVEEQAAIEMRAGVAIRGAMESGLIDEQMARETGERFQRLRGMGLYRKLLREDPQRAIRMIQDMPGGFDEAERQELLTQAVNAHENVLRERRLEEADLARQREAEFKQQQAQIRRDLILADADGRLTVADVKAVTPYLEPENARLWLDRARSGSGSSSNSTNRVVYLSLDRRARTGDPTAQDAIDAAYEAGDITKTDYRTLKDDELRVRFGSAKEYLSRSLDTGEVILDGSTAGSLAVRRALAERELDLWIEANPDATRDEAMARADHIAQTAQLVDLEGIAAYNLQPTLAVRSPDRKTIDIGQTERRIVEAVDSGQITDEQADYEFQLLQRIETIQARSQMATGTGRQ